MKMNPKLVAAIGTYFRALLVLVITLMATIGKSPWDFSADDWKMVANGVWVSFLPVIMRALNPKDETYGKIKE